MASVSGAPTIAGASQSPRREPTGISSGKRRAIIRDALDRLGLALVEHGHVWTNDERRLYEQAASLVRED